MEPDRAIEIVQSLADGVDPHNGERFPFSSPYQQADTVRALGTTSVTSQHSANDDWRLEQKDEPSCHETVFGWHFWC